MGAFTWLEDLRAVHASIRIAWGLIVVISTVLGVFFGIVYYDDRSIQSIVFVCDTITIDSLNNAVVGSVRLKNPSVDWLNGYWSLSYFITLQPSPNLPLFPYIQSSPKTNFTLAPL